MQQDRRRHAYVGHYLLQFAGLSCLTAPRPWDGGKAVHAETSRAVQSVQHSSYIIVQCLHCFNNNTPLAVVLPFRYGGIAYELSLLAGRQAGSAIGIAADS